MQDKKYATIQFTSDDFARIKAAQASLEDELGVRLPLAQTVVYGVDKLNKMEAIKRRLAYYEAMEANAKAAQQCEEYQITRTTGLQR